MKEFVKITQDKYTREEDKRFTLRIDKKLFYVIEAYAKINKRAIGREIEFVLENHYKSLLKEKSTSSREIIKNFLSSENDLDNNI